jgi:hypothetical protein
LGAWRLSTIILGKCVSQERKQREKIHMVSYNSFKQSMFLHEQQAESREEELGAEETMEGGIL